MKKSSKPPATVDDYIAGFSGDVKKRLQQLRSIIKKAAPKAEECISYQMAGYKHMGMLIYVAAHKNHIGLYPVTAGMQLRHKKEIEKYQASKATLQFPHDQPVPFSLISKLVKTRVIENEAKAEAKKNLKSAAQKKVSKK
jgi:uncharacterized protein YdhG (YjbR/CyaY superfamily)